MDARCEWEPEDDSGQLLLQLPRADSSSRSSSRVGPPAGKTVRRPEQQQLQIYGGDDWHLSDAGRHMALSWQGQHVLGESRDSGSHPLPEPSDAMLLQDGASAVEGPGEDQVLVHYTMGFFGAVAGEQLTAEQCDVPCAKSPFPGAPGVPERADLLVTFPILPDPPKNSRGAPALAHSMEAGGLYGSQFSASYAGTQNTSLLSTVPWPYFDLGNWREIQGRARGPAGGRLFPGFGERLPAAVFVAHNCGGDVRNQLISELVRRGVPVHSISSCAPAGTKQSWPEGVARSDKIGALRRYRVYLALENTVQSSYVTEKGIDGFAAGAVPLYLGAPNADEYLPQDGYISATGASSAASLDELAERVKAAIGNQAEWQSFMAWRTRPLEELNGGDLARRFSWSNGTYTSLCRLCRFAYAKLTPGARWDHEQQQVVGGAPPPARGDVAAWSAWRRGARAADGA
uniref:Fucosyltransferase n=1 Tax=Alexandrium monilatum TaxID=311494 RepID=A0A7S4Q5C3_9DINO